MYRNNIYFLYLYIYIYTWTDKNFNSSLLENEALDWLLADI